MTKSVMSSKNDCFNKYTVLIALLTVGGALSVLVLSIVPPLVFNASSILVPGLIPYMIANAVLCILLCVWLYITGITIRVALHSALTIVSAFAILILSVIPPLVLSNGVTANSGFISHICAYGFLCILSCAWFHLAGISRYPVLSSVLVCTAYGVVIECVQFVIPYRTFELKDIVVNCASVFACAIVAKFIIQCVLFCKCMNSALRLRIESPEL